MLGRDEFHILAGDYSSQNGGRARVRHSGDERFRSPRSQIFCELGYGRQHAITAKIENSDAAPEVTAHISLSPANNQVDLDPLTLQSMGQVGEDPLNTTNLQSRY
jgi:hypothetical protein